MIGIYEIDLENETFVNASSVMYEGLGYRKEDVVGRPVNEFLTSESNELFQKRLLQMRAGRILDSRVEYTCITKDGIRIPVVIEAFYKIANGKIVGAIVAVKEIKDAGT